MQAWDLLLTTTAHTEVPSNTGSRFEHRTMARRSLEGPDGSRVMGGCVRLSFPLVRLMVVLRPSSRSELTDLDVTVLDTAAPRSLGESTAVVKVHNRI